MENKIYEMLVEKDELTWQTIIHELVRTEQLDPWNIDLGILAQKYLDAIKRLKRHNFFVSGKILLASALLLKMKSDKLVTEYIANLDSQLFPQEVDLFEDTVEDNRYRDVEIPQLLIKTPQQRKRQLTLNDLMGALEKALDVDERRTIKRMEMGKYLMEAKLPENIIDIKELIKDVYDKIINFFKKKEKLTFTELVNSDRKEDKIMTFVPLLHLDNQQKVEIKQEKAFGEIEISLIK